MSLFKEIHLNTNFLCGTKVEFNEEIVKYHIMKNKIYLITENAKKKVCIYNVMKLSKIHEFPDSNIDKIVEILSKFDNVTLKSWFTVDIKLGTICLTFQREISFSNPLNFHVDYLEKITNKLISINMNATQLQITEMTNLMKFYIDPPKNNLDTTLMSTTNNTFSSSFGNMKKVLTYSDKIISNGYTLFKSIFSSYILNKLTKLIDYLEINFDDKKGILKAKLLNDDNPNEKLFDKSLYSSSNFFLKNFPNLFIFSLIENNLSIGPYLKDILSTFIMPSFLKELFNIVCSRNKLSLTPLT